MNKFYLLIYLFVLTISCNQNKRIYNKTDGIYEVGELLFDSLFHGLVHKYDSNDTYIGYSNYRYGLLDGVTVYKNTIGIISDSVFYKNGKKEGVSYRFDSDGKLEVSMSFLSDRPVGEWIIYDSIGNVKEYRFRNFEGEEIYRCIYKNKDEYSEFGELPSVNYDTVLLGGKEMTFYIFLYIINIPDLKIKYYLGKVKDGQILSKTLIEKDRIYYEEYLKLPDEGEHYAIIIEIFNKLKGKDDLYVHVLT